MSKVWNAGVRRLVIVLTPVAVLAAAFLYFSFSSNPPKERTLTENFYKNRAASERLRGMLLADEQVRAVYARSGVETTNSGSPRIPSEVNFPVSRYNEYVVLLEQIGSPAAFRRGEGNSEVCYGVWASGFGGDTRHVDNCWLEHEPTNQVASLDEYYKTPKPRHPVFRHIDGNWYLWADW